MKNVKKKLIQFINFFLAPLHIQIRSVYVGGRLFPESFSYLKKVLRDPAPATVIDVGVADGTPELWSAFSPTEYKYLLIEANPAYAEKLKGFGIAMNAVVEHVFWGTTMGPRALSQTSPMTAGRHQSTLEELGVLKFVHQYPRSHWIQYY